MIGKLAGHWVDKYGLEEVAGWDFEVWNEPNLDSFWSGTQDQYFELYRYAAEAIKGVDPSLRVGGPATARNEWLQDLRDFVERENLPLDFLTTHFYPTDALGTPSTDTSQQLSNAPDDVMRQQALEARRIAGELPLYYTEWNISSNPRGPLHDEPFAAVFAIEILMSVADLVEGYSFWTFTDIFEELYFDSAIFHGGFGLLTNTGVPKPVYRGFELLHQLGNERLAVEGTHETLKTWAISGSGRIDVLVINKVPPGEPIKEQVADFVLTQVGEVELATIRRIDEDHANPRALWEEVDRPPLPSATQRDELLAASALHSDPQPIKSEGDHIRFQLTIPSQAVAAVRLDLAD